MRNHKVLIKEPRGPPLTAQAYEISKSSNLAKDFRISNEISRFPARFQDFRKDFQDFQDFQRDFQDFQDFQRDFQDIQVDFQISCEISSKIS